MITVLNTGSNLLFGVNRWKGAGPLYHYWVPIWSQCHKFQWQANIGLISLYKILPMIILSMETQYWDNVAWQENANANGKPTLCQYIHVVWDLICQNLSSIHISIAPQRRKVPISIVAVNRIDHFDWLNIMPNDLNHLSPHCSYDMYPILLISQIEMKRWNCYTSFTYLIRPIWNDVIISLHSHTTIAYLPSSFPCWKSKDFSSS